MNRKHFLYLLLGLIAPLTITGHMRWGSGAAAWLSWVLLTLYLQKARNKSELFSLAGVYSLAMIGATLKIITHPLPYVLALPVGLGMAATHIASAGLAKYLWSRKETNGYPSTAIASLIFATSMTLGEWLQSFGPLATWGAAAYTQVNALALLQVASFTGMAGVSFLLYFSAASFGLFLGEVRRKNALPVLVSVALLLGALLHGRRALDSKKSVPTALVATVGTTGTVSGLPLPDREERKRVTALLHEDTQLAAKRGAQIIVWNEAANVVLPEAERAFISESSALAKNTAAHLVISYVIPLAGNSFTYENKYVWFLPSGRIDHSYNKHFPAPGEPIAPNTEPPSFLSTPLGRASGAICYDYDYPSLSKKQGELAVDFVALPSSDWKGIDPIHTEMSRLRAIESGVNILRSTRFGLSGAIDSRGRIVQQSSSFTNASRVMLARLPIRGRRTFYAAHGDWFVFLCALFLSLIAIRKFINQ